MLEGVERATAHAARPSMKSMTRLQHAGHLEQDKSGLYAARHPPIDIIISLEIEIAESIARGLRTTDADQSDPRAGDGRFRDPHRLSRGAAEGRLRPVKTRPQP